MDPSELRLVLGLRGECRLPLGLFRLYSSEVPGRREGLKVVGEPLGGSATAYDEPEFHVAFERVPGEVRRGDERGAPIDDHGLHVHGGAAFGASVTWPDPE